MFGVEMVVCRGGAHSLGPSPSPTPTLPQGPLVIHPAEPQLAPPDLSRTFSSSHPFERKKPTVQNLQPTPTYYYQITMSTPAINKENTITGFQSRIPVACKPGWHRPDPRKPIIGAPLGASGRRGGNPGSQSPRTPRGTQSDNLLRWSVVQPDYINSLYRPVKVCGQ